MYTSIGGHSGSSTRTELAAAISAIMAKGLIHIGTDSEAFRDKAINILDKLRRHKQIRTNWKTTSDGDLWEHFVLAAKAKSPHAIWITKVKGHITEQQVSDNTHRLKDKLGNDQADTAADIGVKMHGDGVMRIAKLLQVRHVAYIKFMKKVAQHIMEGYLIHRALTDINDSNTEADKKVGHKQVDQQPDNTQDDTISTSSPPYITLPHLQKN